MLFVLVSCTKGCTQQGTSNVLKTLFEKSKNIQGEVQSSRSLENKIVILNFWASWCPPCMQETPSLLKLVSKFKDDVVLVSVSQDDDAKELQKFIQLFPLAKANNVILIHDLGRHWSLGYGVYKLPETYIFDRQAKLLKKFSGEVSFQSPEVESFFKALLH